MSPLGHELTPNGAEVRGAHPSPGVVLGVPAGHSSSAESAIRAAWSINPQQSTTNLKYSAVAPTAVAL